MACKEKDSFIGWKSKDGALEVTGVYSKGNGKIALYKVVCNVCAKDKELFPNEYFVMQKGHLLRGHKPCGCAKKPKWTKDQNLLRASRVGDELGFVVIGLESTYIDSSSKLKCICTKHKHVWSTSIANTVNNRQGCKLCSVDKQRNTLSSVIERCDNICADYGYSPVGFVNGYTNSNSKFTYVCPLHGEHSVAYIKLISGQRCPHCQKEKRKRQNGFHGFYVNRENDNDFLYIMNFDNKFIKVGRSFDVNHRVTQLKSDSGIGNVKILKIINGIHKDIFNLEQNLHDELISSGFWKPTDWSTETFSLDCIGLLEHLLRGEI